MTNTLTFAIVALGAAGFAFVITISTLVKRINVRSRGEVRADVRCSEAAAGVETKDKRLKVLVVDDENPMADEVAFLARQAGFDVVGIAHDACEAFKIAVKEPPDIALMDIRMPGLDGIEATSILRKMLPSVKVIMVTAHDDKVVEALEVGAVDYILKPPTEARLVGSIKRAANLN